MPRLNNDKRNQAIGMLNVGMPATVVSLHFVVLESLSSDYGDDSRVTGTVADRPRSGRPRVTTVADDRYVVLQHLRNGRLTAAATG